MGKLLQLVTLQVENYFELAKYLAEHKVAPDCLRASNFAWGPQDKSRYLGLFQDHWEVEHETGSYFELDALVKLLKQKGFHCGSVTLEDVEAMRKSVGSQWIQFAQLLEENNLQFKLTGPNMEFMAVGPNYRLTARPVFFEGKWFIGLAGIEYQRSTIRCSPEEVINVVKKYLASK